MQHTGTGIIIKVSSHKGMSRVSALAKNKHMGENEDRHMQGVQINENSS